VRISHPSLRPASFSNRAVLFRRTRGEKKKLIASFLDKRFFELTSRDGEKFVFSWDRSEKTEPWHVITLAQHEAVMCGIALFEVARFSSNLTTAVATFKNLRSDFSFFDNKKWTGKSYFERFKGIGTTLAALSLHLAAHFDLPLLRGRQDESIHNLESRQSFYQWLGFMPGEKANQALRRLNFDQACEHLKTDNVFYLNGILDGVIDFVIPEIGISPRL
jgi:hypothetical protein